jgi:hypothetical protein
MMNEALEMVGSAFWKSRLSALIKNPVSNVMWLVAFQPRQKAETRRKHSLVGFPSRDVTKYFGQ